VINMGFTFSKVLVMVLILTIEALKLLMLDHNGE
jgi:hypothetical protein